LTAGSEFPASPGARQGIDAITIPPETDPSAQVLVAAGLEHHQAGRRAEAERLYAAALERDPQEATGLYLLGVLAFELGRPQQAAVLLQHVAELRPRHVEARFTLAGVRHWLGEPAAAMGDYRTVLALDPDHAGALVGLANIEREAGDLTAALGVARAAVARHPGLATAQSAFAATLAAAAQPMAAASAWREVIRLEPDALAAHVGLALALVQAGEAAPALRAADRAIALNPGQADAWFARGAALAGLHDHGLAAVALERSVTLDPNRAAALLALGAAYAELERVGEAEQRLRAAIALDPMMSEAHASLGAVYLMSDRPDAARGCYELALAIDPDMIAAHQSMAGILAEAGEAAQARRHRDRAYRRQNLFVEAAAEPERRVLVLTTAEGGNVPFRYLLPKHRYTRINWFVEYATPGQTAALPAYDVVFNAIGDPDLAAPTAANIEAFLADCEKPVLNVPDKVARTARHLAPGLFEGLADVVVPAVARIAGETLDRLGLATAAASAGLAAPMLVRPVGSHGGKGLVRAETGAALADIALTPGEAAYLTAYRDFASADGLYRKYRMIFVDRLAYPYHLAISPGWLVHHGSAGMAGDPARIAEELAFLKDPEAAIGPRAMAAVAAIGARMDLDYAGLDFALLEDGQVMVFEANATMLVHPEASASPFAHKNPYVARILAAFQALVAGQRARAT
jgi:tetratricopeptide (TPR) repeat protein